MGKKSRSRQAASAGSSAAARAAPAGGSTQGASAQAFPGSEADISARLGEHLVSIRCRPVLQRLEASGYSEHVAQVRLPGRADRGRERVQARLVEGQMQTASEFVHAGRAANFAAFLQQARRACGHNSTDCPLRVLPGQPAPCPPASPPAIPAARMPGGAPSEARDVLRELRQVDQVGQAEAAGESEGRPGFRPAKDACLLVLLVLTKRNPRAEWGQFQNACVRHPAVVTLQAARPQRD